MFERPSVILNAVKWLNAVLASAVGQAGKADEMPMREEEKERALCLSTFISCSQGFKAQSGAGVLPLSTHLLGSPPSSILLYLPQCLAQRRSLLASCVLRLPAPWQ